MTQVAFDPNYSIYRAGPVWAEEAIDEAAEAAAKKRAAEAFTAAIEHGTDCVMPLDTTGRMQWMLSKLLGQTYDPAACAALLKACHAAVHRRDAECAEALRQFVAAAAAEYAADNHEVWA